MATLLEKRKDKFRVWSTISDSWLTDWLSKEEVIRFFVMRIFTRAHNEIKELEETFPSGFSNKKGKIYK